MRRPDDTFYFQNIHFGDIVSAEVEYKDRESGMLRARAKVADTWEKFFVESFGSYVTMGSAANGLFVSAEVEYEDDDCAMLRARAEVADDWERFD